MSQVQQHLGREREGGIGERGSQKTSKAGNVCLVERLHAGAESFPVFGRPLFFFLEGLDTCTQAGRVYHPTVRALQDQGAWLFLGCCYFRGNFHKLAESKLETSRTRTDWKDGRHVEAVQGKMAPG